VSIFFHALYDCVQGYNAQDQQVGPFSNKLLAEAILFLRMRELSTVMLMHNKMRVDFESHLLTWSSRPVRWHGQHDHLDLLHSPSRPRRFPGASRGQAAERALITKSCGAPLRNLFSSLVVQCVRAAYMHHGRKTRT
jgi:hypothetical protein